MKSPRHDIMYKNRIDIIIFIIAAVCGLVLICPQYMKSCVKE